VHPITLTEQKPVRADASLARAPIVTILMAHSFPPRREQSANVTSLFLSSDLEPSDGFQTS
jgi:hypothetical protein